MPPRLTKASSVQGFQFFLLKKEALECFLFRVKPRGGGGGHSQNKGPKVKC